MSLQCCACTEIKSLADFSNSQLRKKIAPRCMDCVELQLPIGLTSPNGGSYRACETCKLRQALEKFSGNEAECKACAQTKAYAREMQDNASQRNYASGACKVKDVKRIYGHLCEIPIAAYREAGVAHSRNDYVTKKDVDMASDEWDARSIAHDIDTQWGTMPWGGAYSDSNHYYGPGAYDYY